MPYTFDSDDFHSSVKKTYFGEVPPSQVKKGALMAKVEYKPLHLNPDFDGAKHGSGKAVSTWVFSEDGELRDHLAETGFNLFIDFSADPFSDIGFHIHHDKEEIYYVLEGSVTMTLVGRDGEEHTQEMFPGDAQFVRIGQGHYGTAGKDGVRVITVCVGKQA
jgi:mannose-6-phosphate isomerase-like protein (cupin superfamily)